MARRRRRVPKNVSTKTRKMIGEGYDPKVAYAASWNMKRRGKLGRKGGYRRLSGRRRGPVGAQRRM